MTLGVEQGEEADRITFKYTDCAFLKKRIQGVLDLVKWVQVTASDVGKNGNRDALNAILICSYDEEIEVCHDIHNLAFCLAHDQEVITRCLNSEKGKHELRILEEKYKVFIDLVPGKEVEVKVVQDSDPRYMFICDEQSLFFYRELRPK